MGGATLKTRLRQIKEHDILVAQESPPPPTFTVPAFRARRHRGGESELLKDAYPSGFCKPPENRAIPTTTKTSTASPTRSRNTLLPLSGPQLSDLLHESKEVGVPPCGAAAGRPALNVTRVVVGAKDVVDTVGSELVQYAGFSVGPAELSSPTSINRSRHSRPPSPASPSRMTIDGSALHAGSGSLLVEARSAANQWSSGRKACSPRELASPRDEGGAWKGRKRVRSATTDRARSPGGPEPWVCPAETLTGRSSSRPSTSASRRRHSPGGAAAPAAAVRADGGGGREQPRGRPLGGEEAPARPESPDSNVANHGIVAVAGHRGDRSIRSPSDTANVADQQGGFLGAVAQENKPPAREEGQQAGRRRETAERTTEGEPALPSGEHPDGSGGSGRRVDGTWAKDKDYPSVWSYGDGDGDGDGDGSTCFVGSASTRNNDDDNDNDSSVVGGGSSLADGSAEQVAGKRSFSTLDTERYRGSLSKDATSILRSHLESRNKPPGNPSSCASDGRSAMATEGTAMMSPAPPPTPPGQQHLDNFFAEGPRHAGTPCYLPPLGRASEGCYVRTRSDIILAVVRKKGLLECDDDAGLRTLKTAARPVRIKADMSMAEGMRAILASGVLEECSAVDACDRSLRGGQVECRSSRPGAADGTRTMRGRPRALEYFDAQEGAWQLVRNESDWKVLLAAQSSPQGAGVVFQAAGASGRGADFLVAVAAVETHASGRDKSEATTTWHRGAPGKLRTALARAPSKGNRARWRYASLVTPRTLRSLPAAPPAGSDCARSGSDRKSPVRAPPFGAAGRDPAEAEAHRSGARRDRGGPAAAVGSAPPSGAGGVGASPAGDDGDDDNDGFRRKLAGLDGGGRRVGPGPGGALWAPESKATGGRRAAGSPSRRPKKAKVRRLARLLEAGLRLKGRPGAGGLPPVGSQRVDLPYTKELAKWSYDEILGIPKATVPAKPPEL